MALVKIPKVCLIPCLPPFSFGCVDESGKRPCQVAYYNNRDNARDDREDRQVNRAEKRLGVASIRNAGKVYDAATTGDSNYSAGAETVGAAGELVGSATEAIAGIGVVTGLFDTLLGGDDDDDGGGTPQNTVGAQGIALNNNALIFGGIGVALVLFAMQRR